MTSGTKEITNYVCLHPSLLYRYFLVRTFTFGIAMGIFGIDMVTETIVLGIVQSLAGKLLIVLGIIGCFSLRKPFYPITMMFLGGFFIWNAFLVSRFIRMQVYHYLGFYTFLVDIIFTVILMGVIHSNRAKIKYYR